ncbi:UNKNOWN [Stylonychia lemnae]|uniref:Uncharacterized protein n=1 Tax=Stylonychia lemnae TaxID=5949 RepID=A0A077ZP26_STYLE|nr:UNKNOWN [Stylonychia lemnae]|eukprot:CDW71214.1 UNKNOWN [Stylonychia lemnae]
MLSIPILKQYKVDLKILNHQVVLQYYIDLLIKKLLSLEKGGFIISDGSNLNIKDSILEYGQAQNYGGAIFLKCSHLSSSRCNYDIQANKLIGNQAGNSGGGIFYDLFRPLNLENNLYFNNNAQYGRDFASYGYKLKILKYDEAYLRQLISGGLINSNSLQLGIFDQDQQLINTDNTSQLIVSSFIDGLSISGNTLFVAVNGIFDIKDIRFRLHTWRSTFRRQMYSLYKRYLFSFYQRLNMQAMPTSYEM